MRIGDQVGGALAQPVVESTVEVIEPARDGQPPLMCITAKDPAPPDPELRRYLDIVRTLGTGRPIVAPPRLIVYTIVRTNEDGTPFRPEKP